MYVGHRSEPSEWGFEPMDVTGDFQKVESYFDPRISFYVKETPLMGIIAKIQAAKKAQAKTENWGVEEIKKRIQKIVELVYLHKDFISATEAHFQGTSRTFQNEWAVQSTLNLAMTLLENIERTEVAGTKGLVGAVTSKSQSFFEIGQRVLYSLFHKDSLVVKPATDDAISGYLWSEILKECDLPEGLISFVYGPGTTVGKFLMDHPGVRNISFSGSFETLKGYPISIEKKYQLLFNGKNCVCVLSDFDFQSQMSQIVRLFVEHNGKSIFSPSRIFVLDTIEKEFKTALAQSLESVPMLNSIDDEYGFLPLRAAEIKKLVELKMRFESEEAKKIFANDRFLFYSDLANCSELHQDNLELPIFNLTSVKYAHEMPKWINNSSFGHSMVIFGSEEKAKKLVQKSEVGKVFFNPAPLRHSLVSPVKQSGFGDVGWEIPNKFYSYIK